MARIESEYHYPVMSQEREDDPTAISPTNFPNMLAGQEELEPEQGQEQEKGQEKEKEKGPAGVNFALAAKQRPAVAPLPRSYSSPVTGSGGARTLPSMKLQGHYHPDHP